MTQSETSKLITIMNILFIVPAIFCNPVGKTIRDKLELKDEIHYPNGSIVGRYSYKDSDGNPISVKYYADKNSYGVELNSFKKLILPKLTTIAPMQKRISTNDFMKPIEPLLDLAAEIMKFNSKNKNINLADTEVDTKKADTDKDTHQTQNVDMFLKFGSPDYETFYQNEVKAPKQCEKDKVRVYLVKEKRKARNAFEDPVKKYCKH